MLIKFTKSCHSMLGFVEAGTVVNTFEARGRFFINEGFAVEFSPEVKETKPPAKRSTRRKKDVNNA